MTIQATPEDQPQNQSFSISVDWMFGAVPFGRFIGWCGEVLRNKLVVGAFNFPVKFCFGDIFHFIDRLWLLSRWLLDLESLHSLYQTCFITACRRCPLVCGATKLFLTAVFSPELHAVCSSWKLMTSLLWSNQLLSLLSLSSSTDKHINLRPLIDPGQEPSTSSNWFFFFWLLNIVWSHKLATSVSTCIASSSISFPLPALRLKFFFFPITNCDSCSKSFARFSSRGRSLSREDGDAAVDLILRRLTGCHFFAHDKPLVDGFCSWLTTDEAPYAEEPCPSSLKSYVVWHHSSSSTMSSCNPFSSQLRFFVCLDLLQC